MVGGHVKLGSVSLTSALGQIRAGAVWPIAVTGEKRTPALPDVPTLAELGFRDLTATGWFGIAGPAKLPDEVVRRLNGAINAILIDPELQTRLAREAIEVRPMDPQTLANFVRGEVERWTAIAKSVVSARPAK